MPKPRFLWRWFLGWTVISSVFIFTALKILTGMSPPQPFLIQPFIDPNLGRVVLFALAVVSFVFSVYFLAFATLPGVGPHTSPAGRWLIGAIVLVICLVALFTAGSISYDVGSLTFSWQTLTALIDRLKDNDLSQELLSIALLLTLILALSTAAVVSNLTTAMRDVTPEQNEMIKWFLLWMHASLTLIVLVYSALLFKTNMRLSQFADGYFILYFAILYLMISVLIFLIPALQYKLLTGATTLWTFAGVNLPPWLYSLLSKTGIESSLPEVVRNFLSRI